MDASRPCRRRRARDASAVGQGDVDRLGSRITVAAATISSTLGPFAARPIKSAPTCAGSIVPVMIALNAAIASAHA